MTGARSFAKARERDRLASEKAVRLAKENGWECSTCPDLTRFVVRAPKEVVGEIHGLAIEAAKAQRPWFAQAAGWSGELSFTIFYAGKEDARKVRDLLSKHQVPEESE